MKMNPEAAHTEVRSLTGSKSSKLNAYKVPLEATPNERTKATKEAIDAVESACRNRKKSVVVVIVEAAIWSRDTGKRSNGNGTGCFDWRI
jgi:hypothetical protein